MTSRDFCFWLQGFFEIDQVQKRKGGSGGLTCEQVKRVQEHLALVFKHEIAPPQTPDGSRKKRKASKGATEKFLRDMSRPSGFLHEPLIC